MADPIPPIEVAGELDAVVRRLLAGIAGNNAAGCEWYDGILGDAQAEAGALLARIDGDAAPAQRPCYEHGFYLGYSVKSHHASGEDVTDEQHYEAITARMNEALKDGLREAVGRPCWSERLDDEPIYYHCKVCGEPSAGGFIDCCPSDDLPEPGDIRETGP